MDALAEIEMTEAEAEALLSEDMVPEPEPVSRETEPDPAAPFGRFKNGKARKSTPGKTVRRPTAPAAPKGPRAPSRKPSRPTRVKAAPDYRTLCREFIAVPETILGLTAASRKSEKLMADAITVNKYADALAEFGADMAAADARFAAALEGWASKSPWMKGVALILPMMLQFGANHDVIPPVDSLGVVSRETLLKEAAPPSEDSE